jgi:hypothetical protein
VGGDHARYAGGRRIIVEEDISPAIDLEVDEAGRQPTAAWQIMNGNLLGQLVTPAEPLYLATLDNDGAVAVRHAAVEHGIGSDRMRLDTCHVVRVTF